jgi:hypothetical protein
MLVALLAPFSSVAPAYAASINSAAFGGSGTTSVGGTVYARSGATIGLTVSTSGTTKCVNVSGDHTGHQQSDAGQAAWLFSFTALSGSGVKNVTITIGEGFNSNDVCTTRTATGSASYTLDNTGPVVTATMSPAANAAGWNNSDAVITWSATDAGSGIASIVPAADSVTSNTGGVTKTAIAVDRVGNTGNGSVTVKLD